MKKFFCFLLFVCCLNLESSPFFFGQQIVAAGGGGGTPTFGSEIARNIETSSASSTTTAAVSGAVAQNERVVIIVTWNSASQTITSVTDTKGNTYSKLKESLAVGGGADNLSLWSANAGTALTTSDTLTINWGTAGNTYRAWAVFRLTGCNTTTQPDVTANADAFNTAVTAAASTTTANTVVLGVVFLNNNFASKQYSLPNWTASGARQDWAAGDKQNAFLYKNLTATGSQDPGGTITPTAENYSVIWVAFK